jgi:hypothetical protein
MLTDIDQPLDKLDDLKPDEMYVPLPSNIPHTFGSVLSSAYGD